MRIAIPVHEGRLALHFGHCSKFAIIDVDEGQQKVIDRQDVEAPPHEPGLLPRWLAEKGVELIIAGGLGRRAQDLLVQYGIRVMVGAPVEKPEDLAQSYLSGDLKCGDNVCDH